MKDKLLKDMPNGLYKDVLTEAARRGKEISLSVEEKLDPMSIFIIGLADMIATMRIQIKNLQDDADNSVL